MSPRPLLPARAKRWLLLAAKLLIVGLVVVFVGGAARDAWRELTTRSVRVDLPMAFASGIVFLLGLAPMAWFWRQTLAALGQSHGWARSIHAFYVSQLGKYVPGKASVVLIRTERMLQEGGCGRTIAACVFYETLTHMAVGSLLSAVLLSSGWVGAAPQGGGWLVLASLGMAVVCVAPTWPPVARWLLARVTSKIENQSDDPQETESALQRGLTIGLMAEGWAASALAWCGLAASVWLCAGAVGAPEEGVSVNPLVWFLAAALPVVAGFLSLLPAGVLVRDGLMLGILAPSIGEAGALATTLAVRLIWVVSEVALCGILTFMWRAPRVLPDHENT